MNCPYCNFHFNVLAVNKRGGGEVTSEDLQFAPFVCERCGQIGLIDHGTPRKIEPFELEALKKAPAWKVIEKAVEIVKQVNRQLRHQLN